MTGAGGSTPEDVRLAKDLYDGAVIVEDGDAVVDVRLHAAGRSTRQGRAAATAAQIAHETITATNGHNLHASQSDELSSERSTTVPRRAPHPTVLRLAAPERNPARTVSNSEVPRRALNMSSPSPWPITVISIRLRKASSIFPSSAVQSSDERTLLLARISARAHAGVMKKRGVEGDVGVIGVG